MKKEHIIIYSHGFGVRKDDRGLLSDIANAFPETENVLFDYNIVSEDGKTLTVLLLREQAEVLRKKIKEVKEKYPEGIIDIIGHSQGCVVVGLENPTGIRKIVFVAPSFDLDAKRTINMFKDRPGTEINLSGISRLARKDGTTTLIPPELWKEKEEIKIIPLYNELAVKNDIVIINAKQDNIHGDLSTDGLTKKINLIYLDGDHQFSGSDRFLLIKKLQEILK